MDREPAFDAARRYDTTATFDQPISYGARLSEIAAADPDGLAIVFVRVDGTEEMMSWERLDRWSSRTARRMLDQGLAVGDRVSLQLANSPELVVAVFAAWKVGAVPVPVRWDLPDWELERVLSVIGARIDLSPASHALLEEHATEPIDVVDIVGAATSPQTHGICSSGSTGTPKVIVIDRPALWNGKGPDPFPIGWGDIARPQVVLTPGPLYHSNGFLNLPNLLAGDALVIFERFDAARIVDVVERHRVTTITATPTMLQRIADVPDIDQRDLSSLVWVLQGAASIAPSLVHRWIELIGGEKFFMAYGMTEGLGFTALRGDEWLDHPGSVGRGYRGTEIRILDPLHAEVATGEIGEIYLRWAAGGMYRYLGGASRLGVADDGYASGGDLGYVDEQGYLFIADRRSDLIISGGANVYPAEVEHALGDHPAVADVVVIGLADPEWGRRVHAIVEPHDRADPPEAAELIDFAKSRLAPYKVPKTVELVDQIPRTEATKVNRRTLIDERGG